jgi:hypothetical protein
MSETKHLMTLTPYASRDDFRRIFEEDMNGLYLLSLLLTADRRKAEQCFISGLDGAIAGNSVFKEWAHSWARRAIILSAVRAIKPMSSKGNGRSPVASVNNNGDKTLRAEQPAEIAAVLGLAPFERFVYVITVLDRYSDQDCSVLVGCTRRDVLAARIRAFAQLGNVMEAHHKPVPDAASEDSASHECRNSLLALLLNPRLATSA